MGKNYTRAGITASAWTGVCLVLCPAFAQAQSDIQSPTNVQQIAANWRQIGNFVMDGSLAGLAGGSVSRVWFGAADSSVFVQVSSGHVYQTLDLETWSASAQGSSSLSARKTLSSCPMTFLVRFTRSSFSLVVCDISFDYPMGVWYQDNNRIVKPRH